MLSRTTLAVLCLAAPAVSPIVAPTGALAEEVTVTLNRLMPDGKIGPAIGTVRFVDDKGGLYIQPSLTGLSVGAHGFHIHARGSCAATKSKKGKITPGGRAGGHYDPKKTRRHRGPRGRGHLGDLPRLIAGPSGDTGGWLLAPRLKVKDIRGRALMVHAGGDNYRDKPKKLGGGGGRVACGVIK